LSALRRSSRSLRLELQAMPVWSPGTFTTKPPFSLKEPMLISRSASFATTNSLAQIRVVQVVVGLTIRNPSFSNLSTLKSKLPLPPGIDVNKLTYRVKRAKEKKTKRAKTIKQLTAMGRRHLLGVRVVMKNMVYVVGMKLPAATVEEVSCPTPWPGK
jgi:hypothetical protein